MKRAGKGALVALLIAVASAAFAGPVEDRIVRQLRGQGYTQIEVTRTWLGRSRIIASGAQSQREIIVNPVTGEILRDYSAGRSSPGLLGSERGGAGAGGHDSDTDGDGYGDGDGGDD